jgi:hypothetical protein
MRLTLLPIAACFLPACLDLTVPLHEGLPSSQAEAVLRSGAYRGPTFVKVNKEHYPTQLNKTDLIDVFVSRDALDAYRPIVPDVNHQDRSFPLGGIIVREVQSQSGEVKKITVMVKQPPGYFPEVGDFLFGVTSPDGTLQSSDKGELLWGTLGQCVMCHDKRQGDAFLFGVPSANRSSEMQLGGT